LYKRYLEKVFTNSGFYKDPLVIIRTVSSVAAFAALAEPRRRAMLLLVRNEPLSVNDIAGHFDISQQAVSQHLQVLRDAGLVEVRPEGQRRLYVVRPEGLEAVSDYLAELWPHSLDNLKRAVESKTRSGRGR
jgi:DNA-binding transcriptional ArsR family regulator